MTKAILWSKEKSHPDSSQGDQQSVLPFMGALIGRFQLHHGNFVQCCAKRLHDAIVVCNVGEGELTSTLAALHAILHATISEVDTWCNFHVACNVASFARTFTGRKHLLQPSPGRIPLLS